MLSPADDLFLKIMADALEVSDADVAERIGVDSVAFRKEGDAIKVLVVDNDRRRHFVLRLVDPS